jgi:hypothetical protein
VSLFKIILAVLCLAGSLAQAETPIVNGHHTGYVKNPHRYKRAQFREFKAPRGAPADELPDNFDLEDYTPIQVRNQGGCGSCWWFGTKGMMEWLIADRDGKDVELSGQWGIDCNPAKFYGCGGGWFAFDKLQAPYGAVYESEYPKRYTARNQSCETRWLQDTSRFHEQVVAWGYIGSSRNPPEPEEIQRAMYTERIPIGMTVGASGLRPDKDGFVNSCSVPGTDHIVWVAGWKTVNGVLYWKMVNSWDVIWGDRGFAYVKARGPRGEICAALGKEEVVYATYKSACQPQPKADAGPEKTVILAEGLAKTVTIGSPAQADTTYEWSPKEGLSDPHAARPRVSPKRSTTYTVTATTKCGAAKSSVAVRVYKENVANRVMEVRR